MKATVVDRLFRLLGVGSAVLFFTTSAHAVSFTVINVQGEIDVFGGAYGTGDRRTIAITGGRGAADFVETQNGTQWSIALELEGAIRSFNNVLIPLVGAQFSASGGRNIPGHEPLQISLSGLEQDPRGFSSGTAHASLWDQLGRDFQVYFQNGIQLAANPGLNRIFLNGLSFVPGHFPAQTGLELTYHPNSISPPSRRRPPTEIPEPASCLLLGLGLLGVGRRRIKQS